MVQSATSRAITSCTPTPLSSFSRTCRAPLASPAHAKRLRCFCGNASAHEPLHHPSCTVLSTACRALTSKWMLHNLPHHSEVGPGVGCRGAPDSGHPWPAAPAHFVCDESSVRHPAMACITYCVTLCGVPCLCTCRTSSTCFCIS